MDGTSVRLGVRVGDGPGDGVSDAVGVGEGRGDNVKVGEIAGRCVAVDGVHVGSAVVVGGILGVGVPFLANWGQVARPSGIPKFCRSSSVKSLVNHVQT